MDSHSYSYSARHIRLRIMRVFLIGICINVHSLVNAQQPVLKFTNISTEQGLSENTVLDIIQDPYGFMWFATENGLTKFDGMNYTVFRNDYLDTTTLANDEIQSLCISRCPTQGVKLCVMSRKLCQVSLTDLLDLHRRICWQYHGMSVR